MRIATIVAVVGAGLALAAPACAAPGRVLYVGDSLGVGTTPGLARELGSTAQIEGDSRIGRPSSEGLRVLGQRVTPADDIVIFDVGTNDDPANPRGLAVDLAAARRATGNACLIVATLNRPPLNGVSVDGLNQAVLAFASAARNVQLVDWNAIVASQPDLLGPDHVHPTAQGYALRAQLFAEAVAECAAPSAPDELTPKPAPARPPRHKPGRPRPTVKVPGIEASGISFTEPVSVNGRPAQLLLPNTKGPYPAVVMLRGAQAQAEFLAAHGIAVLLYRDRGSAADARAAVDVLRHKRDIRPDGIGMWAFGPAAPEAAEVAAGNRELAAVVLMSPETLPRADERDWRVQRVAGAAPAVTNWLRTQARTDAALRKDPAGAWRQVTQPVLAIWGTRDDQVPIHASAAALSAALASGPNRDRTFRTFDATHGGVVSYRAGEPHFAPGLLEETARWLGLHLGVHRAAPVIHTPRPPADHPKPIDVANASTVYSVPVRALWLLLPALMLVAAAMRARSRTRTLIAIGAIAGVAMLAAIAAGIASVLDHAGHVGRIAGTPWPFALAFVLAAACAVVALVLARRRAFLAAAACGIWIALALFVLL